MGAGRAREVATMPGSPDKQPTHGASARRRVLASAAVGAVAGGLSGLVIPWTLAPLAGWDVAALVYVATMWARVWRLDAGQTARYAAREDPTRAAADLLLLSAATAS